MAGRSALLSAQLDLDSSISSPAYNSSCLDCKNHVREMIRIHDLWQVTKKELKDSRKLYDNLLNEYKLEVDSHSKQNKQLLDSYTDEIRNLNSELNTKSAEIKQLRNENYQLHQQIDEVNSQLATTNDRLTEQLTADSSNLIRIKELEKLLTITQQNTQNQAKQALEINNNQYEQQLRRLTNELHGVQRERDEIKRDLMKFNAEKQFTESRINRELTEKQFEERNKQQSQLHHIIEQQKQDMDQHSAIISKQSAEISQLKHSLAEQTARERQLKQNLGDNNALNEFKRSRQYIESRLDSLQGECDNVNNLLFSSSLNEKDKLPTWLPQSVANLIKQFRVKLGGADSGNSNIANEILSTFLISLNRIWREKLEEKVKNLRAKHNSELIELRRRLQQRIPYEQVVQKARILRLQKDLDEQRAVYLKSKGDNATGLLDLSLNTVENLSKQIMQMEKENGLLKGQLNAFLGEEKYQNVALFNSNLAQNYLDSLADKIRANSAAFVDRILKVLIAYSGENNGEISAEFEQESQLYLDAIEDNVTECKKQIKAGGRS
jgi:hypothetical protein